MAYLAFAELPGDAVSAPAAPADAIPARAGFSALEWSVVAIAERDRLSSLRAPGRLSMALGTLFGEPTNPRLADTRLEALRRMAVLTWHHGYRVAESAVRAFFAAGFTPDHYELLTGSIVTARAERHRRSIQ